MEYLLHLSREPLYLLHWIWPLPIGLGGRYAQSIKQGQEEHLLTRFKFWTHTPFHLASYTCNKISPPYVSHNKYKIGFCARNGQFKSIFNPHFFEEMKFARFEELDPIYFQMLMETMGDEAELGDDSQSDDEEVQDLLAKDTQKSEDQLDENSDSQDDDTEEESNDDYEDVDDNDVPTEQQQPPIIPDPFPVAHADTNFIQTFVANIFIF